MFLWNENMNTVKYKFKKLITPKKVDNTINSTNPEK